ncbi:hypothetical protein RFI_37530, partial [Reticulomyxa filosa]
IIQFWKKEMVWTLKTLKIFESEVSFDSRNKKEEYLRMTREATIDKENLDYLNHHRTFYIYDMTDNLQYWMIVVEKESFIVCCENGGLPSLQFFEITHHNIAPTCLDTAKSMMVHTMDNKHSKFSFGFQGKHYGKSERENRYLEKFWNGLVFSKEKGKYCFKSFFARNSEIFFYDNYNLFKISDELERTLKFSLKEKSKQLQFAHKDKKFAASVKHL